MPLFRQCHGQSGSFCSWHQLWCRKVWVGGEDTMKSRDKDNRNSVRWFYTWIHEFVCLAGLETIQGVRRDIPLPTAPAPQCFCSSFPFSLQDHAGTGPAKCVESDNALVNLTVAYQLKGWHIQYPATLPVRSRGWVNLCHLSRFCQPPTFNTMKTEPPLFLQQKSPAIQRQEVWYFIPQNEQSKKGTII